MTHGWLSSGILAGLIGWGVVAGMAQGADPQKFPIVSTQAVIEPLPPPIEIGPPPPAPVLAPPAPVKKDLPARDAKHYRVRDWLTWPWGCWAHMNSVYCGSFCSDWNFIFSSCRGFYGDPCLKNPNRDPAQRNMGYGGNGHGGNGHGGNGYGGNGCSSCP